jgi:hypothetical protein
VSTGEVVSVDVILGFRVGGGAFLIIEEWSSTSVVDHCTENMMIDSVIATEEFLI